MPKRHLKTLEAGSKPSTWFPPGELVELSKNKILHAKKEFQNQNLCFIFCMFYTMLFANEKRKLMISVHFRNLEIIKF